MRDCSAGVCQPRAPPVSGGPARLHTHEHSQPLAYPVRSWFPVRRVNDDDTRGGFYLACTEGAATLSCFSIHPCTSLIMISSAGYVSPEWEIRQIKKLSGPTLVADVKENTTKCLKRIK